LTDCCTALDDSVAIAALFRALVRHTINHPERHKELSAVQRALVEESRWRAQRFGTDGSYIDMQSLEPVSFRTWLEAVLSMLTDDIDALQIEDDVPKLRAIPKRGTSAHLQLEYYRALQKFGRTSREAVSDVSKWLRACTESGDFIDPERRERNSSRAHVSLQFA
jgi:carboxylate-amine ligase